MTLIDALNIITEHTGLSIGLGLIIVLQIFSAWISWDNRRGLKQIRYTLFGHSYEKDVNGHGLYQKVDELENELEGDDK